MERKYSYELKKFIVTVLENGIMSASELSRQLKIHKGVICRLYNKYKHQGESSLHYSYTRNEYSSEFKLKVLKYKLDNNLSYDKTALYFNIPSGSAIYDWYKSSIKDKEEIMPIKKHSNSNKETNIKDKEFQAVNPEELSELEYLRQRVSELETKLLYSSAEIAYLKKLDALMQEKQLKQQKKVQRKKHK